jgi:hypothetical protein
VLPPEMPALTRLERMVLDAGYDIHQGSFDEHCERFSERLRREIALVREAREAEPSDDGPFSLLATIPRHHPGTTSTAFSDIYDEDDHVTMRVSAPRAVPVDSPRKCATSSTSTRTRAAAASSSAGRGSASPR